MTPDESDIQMIDEGADYYHVRFRNPDDFEDIRTPDWARQVAESVSEGAEVRTGRYEGDDEWSVQSVLVKKQAGEDKAKEQATKIIQKIEEAEEEL